MRFAPDPIFRYIRSLWFFWSYITDCYTKPELYALIFDPPLRSSALVPAILRQLSHFHSIFVLGFKLLGYTKPELYGLIFDPPLRSSALSFRLLRCIRSLLFFWNLILPLHKTTCKFPHLIVSLSSPIAGHLWRRLAVLDFDLSKIIRKL